MKNPNSSLFKRPLIANRFFHVYNRTNNKELLFRTIKDHHNFLDSLSTYIKPFANILAYNLMSNHFHLLIETLDKQKIIKRVSPGFVEKLPKGCRALVQSDDDNIPEILSNRFKALFNSYAQSFNFHAKRNGNLFHKSFCRKLVHSEFYLKQCLFYINNNGVKHGHFSSLEGQPWSSYNAFQELHGSLLSLDKISDLFDGRENVIRFHTHKHNFKKEEYFSIEEEDLIMVEKEENEF